MRLLMLLIALKVANFFINLAKFGNDGGPGVNKGLMYLGFHISWAIYNGDAELL